MRFGAQAEQRVRHCRVGWYLQTSIGRPPEFFKTIRENVAALKPDDDSLKAWRARAPLLTHHEWLSAEIARARLRQQWAGLFREFDVVLCPPFAVTAFPHDQKPDQEDRTIDIDGESHPYLSLIVWATLATPPGLPATVMPAGRSKTELPIGVQIIGPLYETAPRLRSLNCLKGSTADLRCRPKSRSDPFFLSLGARIRCRTMRVAHANQLRLTGRSAAKSTLLIRKRHSPGTDRALQTRMNFDLSVLGHHCSGRELVIEADPQNMVVEFD